MPNRIITKNLFVVILWAAVATGVVACRHNPVTGGEPPSFEGDNSDYGKPRVVGRIETDEITESSGLAASRCQENVLWTHNDSGDGPFIFAIDTTGRDLGTWKVENAENIDWEDIASYKDAGGKCFLYIGDIGNSKKYPREEHKIYRIAEPEIPAGGSQTSRKTPALTAPAEIMTFVYSDELPDAETLMVHPVSAHIYVVTKQRDKPAGIYKIKPSFGSAPIKAERLGDLMVPSIPNGFLTGGDISSDGRRVVFCDYFAAYEFTLANGAKSFEEIWKAKPAVIDLGNRVQGEAIGYSADGSSLFATSEKKNQPLIEVTRR